MTDDNPRLKLARTLLQTTDRSLFLTGKAGTGKTTFLRTLRETLDKRLVVLAPTGIAAINARGVTIHSFFQLPFGPYIPGSPQPEADHSHRINRQKVKLIQSLEVIIIDEISMVRADLMDRMDDALRRLRRDKRPFGGVQLLMIGDLQQLPPVVKEDEWALLEQAYDSPYFFSAHALHHLPYVMIELNRVYRQTDAHFLNLLNKIREGQIDQSLIDALNCRYCPQLTADAMSDCVQLQTHNYKAQRINEARLAALPGAERTFSAKVTGTFPDQAYPTDSALSLKVGAQVMFIKNDQEHRYFNGLLGEVTAMTAQGFTVRPHDPAYPPIEVRQEVWNNVRYGLDEKSGEIKEIVDGTFSQYPVRLAWAITIHKSQGLTFDHVLIDASHSFTHGQTYVALSRCRTLEGIVLTAPLSRQAFIADHRVVDYMKEAAQTSHIDDTALARMQQDYAVSLISELFTFTPERIALATLSQIFERELYSRYPKTGAAISEILRNFDARVMVVASNFHQQYEHHMAAGGTLEDEWLQERIRKGAAYFEEILSALLTAEALQPLEVDNKAVQKRLKTAFVELRTALNIHSRMLKLTASEGFNRARYQAAKLKLTLGKPEPKTSTRKALTGQSAGASRKSATARQSTSTAPLDVKNGRLYQALCTWRRRKAEATDIPAYVILQTKAIIAISSDCPPTTTKELLNIPYLGKKTCDTYGAEILGIIHQVLGLKV